MSAAADDVKSIFGRVLERVDPAARAAYIAKVCGDNASLRDELESLLAALERAGDFLERVPASDDRAGAFAPGSPGTAHFGPAADAPTVSFPGKDEQAGAVIAGRYKLLQQIGEGGMGTVWMADQTEPVKRRVAVKLIRVDTGQSTDDPVAVRGRAPGHRADGPPAHRQAARRGHHGRGGGATVGTGRPYFVMELVKGVPLTEYCDAHKLGIPERLKLFVQICSAVQHAHQKGIIHRDLKPTNILVESHDGKPVPKVIDFGLAKADDWAAADRAHAVHRVRDRGGHAPVHGPGAGDVQCPGRGHAGRRVRPGRHPVRAAHRHHAADAGDNQEGRAATRCSG